MARLRLLAFLALLCAALAGLHAAGSGALAGPPSLAGLRAWLDGRDPVIAMFALLRLGSLALGWYLLAVTILGALARAARARRFTQALDAVTLPGIRRLLNGCLGVAVALAATAAVSSSAASATTPPSAAVSSAPPVMHWLGQLGPLPALPALPAKSTAPATRTSPSTSTPPPASSGGMAAAPAAPARTPASSSPPAPDTAAPSVAAPGSLPPGNRSAPGQTGRARPLGPEVRPLGPETGTWTVRAGDHFWRIAEETLVAAWGRQPTDAEIAPYWAAVVDANRDRLAIPGQPDFVYPGQVFTLPSPPAAPS